MDIYRLLGGLSGVVKAVFVWGMRLIETPAVWLVWWIKKTTGCRTYHVENITVALVLLLVLLSTGNWTDPFRWVEALAVFMTFSHAGIAQRMEEQQRLKLERHGEAEVDCFYKLEPMFIGKETLWMITFAAAGLWSALAGVFVFLMYYPWCDAWRRHHPLA